MDWLRQFLGGTRSELPSVVGGLPVPPELLDLARAGHWPRTDDECNTQNLRQFFPAERVKLVADNETFLYLYAPPMMTVAQLRKKNKFWDDPLQAPQEISFKDSLCIGDFGIGSDAPIILDYRKDVTKPVVMRLKYFPSTEIRGKDGKFVANTHWVVAAETFSEFVERLDLWNVRFDRSGMTP